MAVATVVAMALATKAVVLMPHTTIGYCSSAAMFVLGYEFADFGSGVYHWSLDNYGSARTPKFGK